MVHYRQEGDRRYHRRHMLCHLQGVRSTYRHPYANVTHNEGCYNSYTEHDVTDSEFKFLNQRAQEQLRRTAAVNFNTLQPNANQWASYYSSPAQPGPDRLRRVGMLPLPAVFYVPDFN